MLKVEGLKVSYGNVPAVFDVSLEVRKREIVCLIGPNGSGKSTTLCAISRFIRCDSGTVIFMSEEIMNVRANEIVHRGLVQVPEGRRLFSSMSVLENLELGAFNAEAKQVRHQTFEEVYDLFPILMERKRQLAGLLSGGEQQMLAVARGLMAKPKLLMLDEPSLGLAPLVVKDLMRTIHQINHNGVSILLVEQSALQALKISTRGYVMDNGVTIIEGDSEELLDSDYIKKAYFVQR